MSTDVVLHSPDQAFALADRIAKSNLIPSAYRNKPVEAAVAMMYGAEIGLPPMTALNRIVVVEGKPALDAQGMVAVIRSAGHSISGSSTSSKASIRGRRADNGDEMQVEFTIEDAMAAGLAQKDVWRKYPKAMLWARAVSQLARMLFADCLMGISYTPEEADFSGPDAPAADDEAAVSLPAPPVPTTEAREAMDELVASIKALDAEHADACKSYLREQYGPANEMVDVELIREAIDVVQRWPESAPIDGEVIEEEEPF